MQMTVLAISLVLMAAIAAAFLGAVRASGSGEATEGAEGRRSLLILVMIVVGVVVTVASLRPWPHVAQAGEVAGPVVNVSGGQWYWEIDGEQVPQGVPVTFLAHTTDVTHGFGVMDPEGRILFQVQVMPGYVNRVAFTFDRPGTYRVVCLEYCGVAHHDMITEFTVGGEA